MKNILTIILILLSTICFSQYGDYRDYLYEWEDELEEEMRTFPYKDTIYIDPENENDPSEDGSLDHPYDEWADLFSPGLDDSTAYLQKRGTSDTNWVQYVEGKQIFVGAYGAGDKPRIVGATDPESPAYPRSHPDGLFHVRPESNRIMFDSLVLTGGVGDETGYNPVILFGIELGGSADEEADWTSKVVINECEIAYCGTGIGGAGGGEVWQDSLLIQNNHIHHCLAEGIFGGSHLTTLRENYLHDISMDIVFGDGAGGDGFQISPRERNGVYGGIKYINNIIDRSSSVNKFCIIHSYGEDISTGYMYMIGNTFYPPRDTGGYRGTCVFLTRAHDMYIINNKFIGRDYNGDPAGAAMYIEAIKNLYVIGNLYDSVTTIEILGGFNRKNQWLVNNTFSSVPSTSSQLIRVITDSLHYWGNIFTLRGDSALIVVGANTGTTSGENIFIRENLSEFDDLFTNWEESDFTLKATSDAIDETVWREMDYPYWAFDLGGVAVPQVDGAVTYTTPMDAGAYQYDDGATPTYPTIPRFTAESYAATTSEGIRFYDLSYRNPIEWLWSFSNDSVTYLEGTTNESQNPVVRFDFVDDYSVTLKATNIYGDSTLTKVDSVEISASLLPVAEFTVNNYDPEQGDTLLFENTSNNSPTEYVWRFSGGDYTYLHSTDYKSTDPEVRFDEDETYTAELVATNEYGFDTYTRVLDGADCSDTTIVILYDTTIIRPVLLIKEN